MRSTLDELDRAIFHHEQWHEDLNRTLICRLSPDRRDVNEDAHHNCRFGQWLYGPACKHLAQYPGLKEIECVHERMHRSAKEMLDVSSAGQQVALDRYERFVNALRQLHLEILTTKRELEDTLYNLDPLSGAASRIGMLTKLREQQALVRRKVLTCSVAMMDIDHFKTINDIHGHVVGDRVIVATSQYILRHLRSYDTLFRYGGEEFLICEPNTDLKSSSDNLERLRAGIAAMRFDGARGQSFQITVSFGLTLLDPDVSVEQSIERADKAVYAAKAAGRNRVLIWAPLMS
jgi:diguanylate cyclase (GGDEF)-like protein